jgi:pimeloyl-ACP methyl ester carboxylesterase
MTGFNKRDIVVDDVRVTILEAGRGKPLIYFHGAGALAGFDDLLPLSANRRLIVPIHPGFGDSDDDVRIDSMLDYVVHYKGLFDQLGLDEPFDLAGHSLGGWMAALFTILNAHRVQRLALASPAGLRVAEHPTADLFTIPADKQLSHLVASPEILARLAAVNVTNEMKVARYREMTTLARIAWDRNYEPKFDRWLPKISIPTLILWGEQDRAIPAQQAKHWANRLPNSEVTTFPGVGHLLFSESKAAVKRLADFFEGESASLKRAAV